MNREGNLGLNTSENYRNSKEPRELTPSMFDLKRLLDSSENPPRFSEAYFLTDEGPDFRGGRARNAYHIYKDPQGRFILMNTKTRQGVILSEDTIQKGSLLSSEEFVHEKGKTGKVIFIDLLPSRPSDPKELEGWLQYKAELEKKLHEQGE